MNAEPVPGREHWTAKGDVRLFLWEKASTPTFDLHVPGQPDRSAMDYFARLGYDTWCVDMEGYGRSSKHRDINCDLANGADDLEAASAYNHPGTADAEVIEAFAAAIIALDDSVPTGTYVDMCAKLPVVDPEKIHAATLILRGEYDGIASMEDLLDFYARLPNPDKHFSVMPGIAHASLQQKNFRIVYHLLHNFFQQPAPIYRGA